MTYEEAIRNAKHNQFKESMKEAVDVEFFEPYDVYERNLVKCKTKAVGYFGKSVVDMIKEQLNE